MNIFKATLLSATLDSALALILAVFAPSDSRLWIFGLTIAVLWIFPILLSFWSLTKFWLGYVFFLRKKMSRFYKAEMFRNKFPPTSGYFDWKTYFEDIAKGEASSKEAVIKSQFFAGEIEGFRNTRPWTLFLAAQMALEAAMDGYQAPPSVSGLFGRGNGPDEDCFE